MGTVFTDADLKLNFKASFSDDIVPFTIAVDEQFLTTTKLKVSITRFVDDLEDQPEFEDGPPRRVAETVAKHWVEEYDWRKVEANLNTTYNQYTTLVRTEKDEDGDAVPLHFVHHKSPRKDAIPLLFVHGWPGSFLEVEHLLEPLTNPSDTTQPAFHVVAPSIPGYGFSPSPRRSGTGYRRCGAIFHALMLKLGYARFVFQGGDAGDFINRYMAHDFPDSVVAGHSNFWVIPPTPSDFERYFAGKVSDDEKFVVEQSRAFSKGGWAYGQLHQQDPLRLAIGMTDSPIGLAMWLYGGMAPAVADRQIWSPELIVTWTMMHWINGPYGAFSLYKNGKKDGAISIDGIELLPYVHQPVAISEFPYDLWYRTPLDWARRGGNVKYRVVHERGGHFAAFDAPDLLVNDIRKFFGDRETSGTGVFQE